MNTIPPRRPPEVITLLTLLRDWSVDLVLHGSVAAMAYGVELEPADLDVTPALDAANLERLGLLLVEIGAVPEDLGHWETKPDGERRWIGEDNSPKTRLAWRPDVDDLTTFDHLFFTRHGDFDVFPEVGGTYTELVRRAERIDWNGLSLRVAHIDDLLARMTVPRREKDIQRVTTLRRLQREKSLATSVPTGCDPWA